MPDKPIIFDASVLINLLATDVGDEILQCLQAECLVCTVAAQETMYVRPDEPGQPVRPVSVNPWIQAKLIEIVAPEGQREETLYVQFASQLDDGEAMSLAVCQARGCTLATDDRKARRLASSLTPDTVAVLSTAEVLHFWAGRTNTQAEVLRETIRAIERRARFVPSQGDPFRDWWLSRR
jgi:predicted nucleic acid-binding protein